VKKVAIVTSARGSGGTTVGREIDGFVSTL